MRTPSWREVEEFLRIDGCELVRTTDHSFYRKVLPDGTVLRTHTSFAGDKSMSAGRFALILRTQLNVSEDGSWEVLRTRRAVARPGEALPEPPPAMPAWVVQALRRSGTSLERANRRLPG